MIFRELFPGLRPQEISYNQNGVSIRGKEFPFDKPRIAFLRALTEFEQEENNSFETLASGTRIQLDTKIGDGVKFGSNCVIGGYGFGYEQDESGSLIRMPHLSSVIIEDGVTIHNNVNVDRGVLTPTIIGSGTVIDSLSHIAHGVKIGKGCCIVAQSGIGGSCEIGDNVFIGFGATIKNKIKVGDGAVIGMGSVVLKDVPAGETWIGNPARKLEKSKFQQRLNEEMNK